MIFLGNFAFLFDCLTSGKCSSEEKSFQDGSFAQEGTSEKGTSTSHSDGRANNVKRRCRSGENGAQKAEQSETKNKLSLHDLKSILDFFFISLNDFLTWFSLLFRPIWDRKILVRI